MLKGVFGTPLPPVLDEVPIPFPGESFGRIYIFHIFGCRITISLWHVRRGETGFRETGGHDVWPMWVTLGGGHL